MILDTYQKKVITATASQLAVIAGPGTGKTFTLTSRIVSLIKKHSVSSSDIIALTFTKKAAEELASRVKERLLYDDLKGIFIGTFHSFAYELLKRIGHTFVVPDEYDLWRALVLADTKKIINQTRYTPKELLSKLANKNWQVDTNIIESPVIQLEKLYGQVLLENNWIDFNRLITQATKAVDDKQITIKPKHLLIDEFQDTSPAQYAFFKQLGAYSENFCVIGDPQQSIYGFAGVDGSVFNRLKRDYAALTTVLLPTNYRSSATIVSVTQKFIQSKQPLQSVQPPSTPVYIVESINEYAQLDWIGRKIEHLIGGFDLNSQLLSADSNNTCTFSQCAILCRTNYQVRQIGQQLIKSTIPFVLVGFDSQLTSQDGQLLLFCLNLFESFLKNESAMVDENDIWIGHLSQSTKNKLKFDTIKLFFRSLVESKPDMIATIDAIINYLAIKNELLHNHVHLIALRFNSIDQIGVFVACIHSLRDQEYLDVSSDQVVISTIHQAKGLEFQYVFLYGLEKNSIPMDTIEEQEEEKRLLYVGMTRAKKGLFLTKGLFRRGKKVESSQFEQGLIASGAEYILDEKTESITKRIAAKKLKKNQQRLF